MKRFVLTVAALIALAAPFPEAHFATFPPKLVEPCIRAGCPEHGIVLDPVGSSPGRAHGVTSQTVAAGPQRCRKPRVRIRDLRDAADVVC